VSGRLRLVFWFTLAAAVVTFCIVQDRVTAAGARRYVTDQREALAGRSGLVTIDEVMRPAVAESIKQALISSGAVAALGLAVGFALAKRPARRRSQADSPDA
jgi:hypothetical protein